MRAIDQVNLIHLIREISELKILKFLWSDPTNLKKHAPKIDF